MPRSHFSLRAALLGALFIVGLIPQLAKSQLRELEITPTQATGAIPVFTNHPEMAAVIINSSITSLQFDSNVGIVEELSRPNDGYYVLIVRPWRQIITVTAPGFRQSRFTVSASQAREVLYYNAEPQAATGNLIPVNFVVTPSNATVYVNDQVMESGRTNQLPAGRQSLRIERSGFRTIEQTIEISSQNTLFTYQMQEVQVTQVVIRSEPSGATLFVDDINVGTTTYANFVYPGVYNIRMMLTNYRTLETQITVEEDGQNQFTFPLERFASELQLTVVPANARIFINRQDYSGQSRIVLAPGRYRLDVEADGYERFSEQVELVQNQPLQRSINLTPLTGNLQFSIRPVDANARLFNSQGQLVEQWQSLRILRNLPVGNYTLRVDYPGYQSINETITITEGQTLQYDRQLREAAIASGTLNVNTLMRDASMFLFDSGGNMVRQWTGSSTVADLPVGTYQLRAQQAGFQNYTQNITIQAGQTQNISVQMVSAQTASNQTNTTAQPQRQTQPQQQTQPRSTSSGSIFKYPSFTSMTFSYTTLALDNANFEDNIESALGLGLYVQSFNGWLMSSFDFGFDRLTLTDRAADTFDDNDYLSVYSLGIGLMPTLPLGGLLVGVGGGLELNQYEDYLANSYAYTNTPYWRAYVALFPKSWSVGFSVDYREAYLIKGYDDKHFQNWTRTNISILIRL